MYQLRQKSILSVSGKSAADFLQTQLTCNVNKIKSKDWCFFGICNRLGKVIASGYLYCVNHSKWFIVIDHSLREDIYQKLYKLGILSNLTIKHENLISPACSITATSQSIKLPNSKYYLNISDNMTINSEEENSFYYDELKAKIPTINIESKAKFTPHMLNLANIKLQNEPALCFDKGCYIGQEYVSKVHHKGLNKRTFTTLEFDVNAAMKINQTIYNSEKQAIGQVIQIVKGSSILAGCIVINNV